MIVLKHYTAPGNATDYASLFVETDDAEVLGAIHHHGGRRDGGQWEYRFQADYALTPPVAGNSLHGYTYCLEDALDRFQALAFALQCEATDKMRREVQALDAAEDDWFWQEALDACSTTEGD